MSAVAPAGGKCLGLRVALGGRPACSVRQFLRWVASQLHLDSSLTTQLRGWVGGREGTPEGTVRFSLSERVEMGNDMLV